MVQANTRKSNAQLTLAGMPEPITGPASASFRNIAPGRKVLYLGRINGGPRYGAQGVVKQALSRKAVVDMGRIGTWHIPYYFLALPHAA